MASFSFREDGEAGEGNQVHVDETKSWRLEKRGGGGWWSPNEEVWCEMRKRVSDRGMFCKKEVLLLILFLPTISALGLLSILGC